MDWNDVTDFYRKRPARFKAIQYKHGEDLPPFQQWYAWKNSEVILNDGDWVVLDIESHKTFIIPEDTFYLVFEKA